MKDKEIQEEIERLNEEALYGLDEHFLYCEDEIDQKVGVCRDAIRYFKTADWLEHLIKCEEALREAYGYIVRKHDDTDINYDYACKECIPLSEIIIDGFQCVYHKAIKENDQ